MFYLKLLIDLRLTKQSIIAITSLVNIAYKAFLAQKYWNVM